VQIQPWERLRWWHAGEGRAGGGVGNCGKQQPFVVPSKRLPQDDRHTRPVTRIPRWPWDRGVKLDRTEDVWLSSQNFPFKPHLISFGVNLPEGIIDRHHSISAMPRPNGDTTDGDSPLPPHLSHLLCLRALHPQSG